MPRIFLSPSVRPTHLACFILIGYIISGIWLVYVTQEKKYYLLTCNSIYPDYPSSLGQSYKKLNCSIITGNSTIQLQSQTQPILRQTLRQTQINTTDLNGFIPCYFHFNSGFVLRIDNKCVDALHIKHFIKISVIVFIFYSIVTILIIMKLCYKRQEY